MKRQTLRSNSGFLSEIGNATFTHSLDLGLAESLREIVRIAGGNQMLDRTLKEVMEKNEDKVKEIENQVDLLLIRLGKASQTSRAEETPKGTSPMGDLPPENEQLELLSILVEASRNVPREKRQKFYVSTTVGKYTSTLHHEGLPNGKLEAYLGDVEELHRKGLLSLSYGSPGSARFDVTSEGFRHYEYLKQSVGQPVSRIQSEVRDYLQAQQFQSRYCDAYDKWHDAEELLWKSDSLRQLTMIGHLCREAMQHFVSALVARFNPPEFDEDPSHTVARLKAVLRHVKPQFPNTVAPLLDAILNYWGVVSDLIQRQEHGAQKEGDHLHWEDGRRVTFQTAVVMFEIDKALSMLR